MPNGIAVCGSVFAVAYQIGGRGCQKYTKITKNAVEQQFLGRIPVAYMFFGTGNPNPRSILQPEVELLVFLRMRSDKIAKNALKTPF